MQVGDLAKTVKGNIVLILEIGDGWANIQFTSNGNIRGGYPWQWLSRWERAKTVPHLVAESYVSAEMMELVCK